MHGRHDANATLARRRSAIVHVFDLKPSSTGGVSAGRDALHYGGRRWKGERVKVLLLTFYYPPDLSAGSFRAAALADALLRAGGTDLSIDVLTSRPNRYASYRDAAAEACAAEPCVVGAGGGAAADRTAPASGADAGASGRLTVTRLRVGAHRGGLVDQSLVFSGFAARALRAVRGQSYDLVLATSSRLFTGYLGATIAARVGASLYLDIRDLFVHNMRDMYRDRRSVAMLLPLLSFVERRTFQRAARVNLVSEGFLDYFAQRFPDRQYSVFSNGIDAEFLDYDFSKAPSGSPKRIVYAGNIGLGQGIDGIVPEVAHRLGDAFELRIIGDGGQRARLEHALGTAGIRNVTLMPPMPRASLMQEYRDADYLLLHLNGFSALECVLPSKLFEYAATGKPILAGVGGYARRFIEEHVSDAAVFEPGDADAMVGALETLAPASVDRADFKHRFARGRIMDGMAAEILSLLAERRVPWIAR
jgi:glycosyltransferase involved in cell wall biosynthesis